MLRLSEFAMRIVRALDPEEFQRFARVQNICNICLDNGIVKHHKTADYHETHSRRKKNLNICVVVVLLLCLMFGVTWLAQWKRTVWRFLEAESSNYVAG